MKRNMSDPLHRVGQGKGPKTNGAFVNEGMTGSLVREDDLEKAEISSEKSLNFRRAAENRR